MYWNLNLSSDMKSNTNCQKAILALNLLLHSHYINLDTFNATIMTSKVKLIRLKSYQRRNCNGHFQRLIFCLLKENSATFDRNFISIFNK